MARKVLLFVHGFNVGFDEAIQRSAQLKSDLRYDGPIIAFCWPSMKFTTASLPLVPRLYARAEKNVARTKRHLQILLDELCHSLEPSLIHLLAHSMGNRVLTDALSKLSIPADSKFATVILAAPDIRASHFRSIAAAIAASAETVTLYASSKDRALQAARIVSGYRRAGEGGRYVIVSPGIDSVDATAARTDLHGHGYVTNSSQVIADISELLRGTPARLRFHLRPKTTHGGDEYWDIIRTKY